MGAWGAGLYQDDVTCDVREEYRNRLKIGQTNIEATESLLEDASDFLDDEDDEPLFWFALAETQWKYGRLLPGVKEKAIEKIHSGEDLKRWEENPTLYKKRKKVLEELEKKLNSPQPPEKKVSKLVLKKPIWEAGDVLLYQIHNATSKPDEFIENHKWYGKYVLLKVLGSARFNIGSLPREYYFHEMDVVGIYNWVGDEEPSSEIIEKLELIPNFQSFPKFPVIAWVFSFNRREVKKLDIKIKMKNPNYSEFFDAISKRTGSMWTDLNGINYRIRDALDFAEKHEILINEIKKS